MGQLANAVKAATSVIFGTAPWHAGQASGKLAADVNIFDPVVAKSLVDGMTAGDLYATQPHLRTVVSFIARNVAQLGRHVYTKDADGRTRVEGSNATQLLAKPNDYMTGYDLFNMLFSELALFDFALWVPTYRDGRWQIDPIPGEWITGSKGEDAFRRAGYYVKYPENQQPVFVPASSAIVFRGYSPEGFNTGSSPVRALRSTLAEQVAAMNFREQMWKRGGRVGMFMTRPATAPVWSKEAKQKFIQNWRNNWSGNGQNAGSTPLLEDGMELKRLGFTAKEEQWLEAATLSLSTVAGAYHVPPSMVGVQTTASSFASVKEFRKMLYTETMGPTIAQVEETINTFLFPFIDEPADHYLELNIQEKLQGDFEEQGETMYKAVGGPYMTVNEARMRMNLPKIDGGDDLLAPLNMGAAGNNGPVADQPIDTDSSGASETEDPDETPPKSRKLHHGAHADDECASGHKAPTSVAATHRDSLEKALTGYFARQQKALEAELNTKDPDWWNAKKWNKELKALLAPILLAMSTGVAREVAGTKGLDPDAYSEGQTLNFLLAVADSRADLINSTTRDALEKAIQDADPGEAATAVKAFYEDTNADRAQEVSQTLITFVAAFAATEVARQLMKQPTKTWRTNGSPQSRHVSVNGETVPIDQPFSNGAQWPGDPVLGASGVANCLCGVDITDND